MAAPIKGNAPLTVKFTVRLTEAEKRAMENQRGTKSKSDYVRGLIVQDGRKK